MHSNLNSSDQRGLNTHPNASPSHRLRSRVRAGCVPVDGVSPTDGGFGGIGKFPMQPATTPEQP